MKINLAYGEKGLPVDVPDRNLLDILEVKNARPIKDVAGGVYGSLKAPLCSKPLDELASGKKNAVVVISDQTRPIPYKDILPPILDTLASSGLSRKNISILIGTGIHRPLTKGEIDILVGKKVSGSFKVSSHISRDRRCHIYLGKTGRGAPVYIDKIYLKASLKIITGLIEPHLLAGYSGGPKAICPGLVSTETIRFVHGPEIIDHPRARIGILEGNPFHEEAAAIAKKAGVDFCLNITINRHKEVTGVFAGDFERVHREGVKFLDRFNKIAITQRPDIVITTGGGFPLDNTFYQSIKGPNSVKGVIKKGGIIILAAACREGLGSKEFSNLIMGAENVHGLMSKIRRPGFFSIDQWMAQHLGHVLEKADVYVYSPDIKKELAGQSLVKPLSSPQDGIKLALDKLGRSARILVIPSGPYVLPVLKWSL